MAREEMALVVDEKRTIVNPAGPREKLLELKNKLEVRRITRININCIEAAKGLHDELLKYFSDDYFGGSDVFYSLSADDKLALAEIFIERCRRYIAKGAVSLAAIFSGTYFLTSFGKWWNLGWILGAIGCIYFFLEDRPVSSRTKELAVDYRLKFPFIHRRQKKLRSLEKESQAVSNGEIQ